MLTIRQASVEDVPQARKLMAQLDYGLEEAEVRQRYAAVTHATDHALFVADQDGTAVGLMHLYVRLALDKSPEVIVQALVVDEFIRGAGAGRKLMDRAELWASEQGFIEWVTDIKTLKGLF